ncbi:MAG TPA: bidirectional hydrogenase complex protein HoxE [Anaerolineales bacterium]|nr:bidirectional hydrogenase complex protein HoxE [Anaerolineales bacterium]HRF46731.1 bidirectional hydrogenase complex protein HoxE [Anaerolineales bacterium]
MPTPSPRVAPPSDDKRWRLVEATMRRYNFAPAALIETLHTTQESFGFLEPESLLFVARSLGLPLSRVLGVATFYNYFSMKPQGEHTCVICLGTACYIKGSGQLLAQVEQELGIKVGETTPDGKVSLMGARCIGSCGLAPAGVFDGQVAGKMASATMLAQVANWRAA